MSRIGLATAGIVGLLVATGCGGSLPAPGAGASTTVSPGTDSTPASTQREGTTGPFDAGPMAIDWINGPVLLPPYVDVQTVADANVLLPHPLPTIATLGAPKVLEVSDPASTPLERRAVAAQFFDGAVPVWLTVQPSENVTMDGLVASAGELGQQVTLPSGTLCLVQIGKGRNSSSATWFSADGSTEFDVVVPPQTLGAKELTDIAASAAAAT